MYKKRKELQINSELVWNLSRKCNILRCVSEENVKSLLIFRTTIGMIRTNLWNGGIV